MNSPAETYTVSQLNRCVRLHLEDGLGKVTVIGELSNYKQHPSGHGYFTLKDDTAQIRCAFFKNYQQQKQIPWKEGDQVIIQGLVSLYETRGDYQLIVHSMALYGLGELYRQFELLKQKLTALGLFAEDRKRSLPQFPHAIGVITSRHGAAIHDILTTLKRRYSLAPVYVYTVDVQGAMAVQQIINALHQANQDQSCDVLILARGGGSLEDLMAFNHEQLAYAIYKSQIPVISGVGHESDITIADLVADARAATPTAAAQLATPDTLAIITQLQSYQTRLILACNRIISQLRLCLQHADAQLKSPMFLLNRHWQSVDYCEKQLIQSIDVLRFKKQHTLNQLTARLTAQNPRMIYQRYAMQLAHLKKTLLLSMDTKLNTIQNALTQRMASLHMVSPLATLARGYAIATCQGNIIYDSQHVEVDDTISVKLAQGELNCTVREIK